MKINIEDVEAILLERKVEPVRVQEIIRDLEQAVEDEKANREPGVKEKWEHVIVLDDSEGKLKNTEVVGWVVQQKADQDAGLILSKLNDSAQAQNEGAKKKKNVIKGYKDLFRYLKSKWLKEKGVRIKTKEPVRVLVVNSNQ